LFPFFAHNPAQSMVPEAVFDEGQRKLAIRFEDRE
jgi:hypothetical protein